MEITQELLTEKINNGEKLIIDFYAPWCGPCKMMKPTFERVAEGVNSTEVGVKMYTLNVDENMELAATLGIRGIPTIKVFNEGKEVNSKSGLLLETQITELVYTLING
jgi:thioredoxin 1